MYEVKFLRSAIRDIKKLDKPVREKIMAAIEKCAEDPSIGEPLVGDLYGYYSFHCTFKGVHYRIIYQISEQEITIQIVFVGTRENLYKTLKNRIQ